MNSRREKNGNHMNDVKNRRTLIIKFTKLNTNKNIYSVDTHSNMLREKNGKQNN